MSSNNEQLKPIIAFEKWHDPWGQDDDEEDLDDGFDDEDDGVYKDERDKILEKMMEEDRKSNKAVKALMTPMGPIPVNEYTSPSKNWNFWTGHTNFKITEPLAMKISKLLGVETLDIFSPYRMRIAVGKLFTPSDVMGRITSMINKEINSVEEIIKLNQ